MRVRFYPPTADQIGGELSTYKGTPYYYNQDGAGVGSLLRGVWRVVKPFAVSFAEGVGEQAEKTSREMLHSALNKLAAPQRGRGIRHDRLKRESVPLKIQEKVSKKRVKRDSLGPLYLPVHK